MNPLIAFPSAKPELKLSTHPTDAVEVESPRQPAERRVLEQDFEALRDREANLREYEARLRAWQTKIDTASGFTAAGGTHFPAPISAPRASGTPFEADAALQAAWDKVVRARELLEAEQAHVRDDRLNLKETAALLKRHEAALTAREASLAKREELLAGAQVRQAEPVKQPSAMARITGAPFAMAKSVFGAKATEQE